MLSYRHIYHAGNHADVLKHIVMLELIQALQRKDTPFCYLDTHAGVASYDLDCCEAQKNKEYVQGIERLWQRDDVPALIQGYLQCVIRFNQARGDVANRRLRWYPGSPRLVRQLLRTGDRMILCELHSKDSVALKREFRDDRQVCVHGIDGYQAIKAFLPPLEKRGLVLIDPSYERKDEFVRVADALHGANKRWPAGVLAAWYPMVAGYPIRQFHENLARSGLRKILLVQLSVLPHDYPAGMYGSGLIIVNPPWKTDEHLRELLSWLWQRLSADGLGRQEVRWLVQE